MSPLQFNALVPPFDKIGIASGEPAESLNASETAEAFPNNTEEWKPKPKFTVYEGESGIAGVTIGGIEPPATGERNLFLFRNSSTASRTITFRHKSGGTKAGWEINFSSEEGLELKVGNSILLWYDGLAKQWVNLDAVPSTNSIVNSMVKTAAGIELSKIEEGTNLVKLTGEQTIVGKKLFKPAAPAEAEFSGTGSEGSSAAEIIPAAGQNNKWTVEAEAVVGGPGGYAGQSTGAVSATGRGGEAKHTGKGTAQGGGGGYYLFKTGVGGTGESIGGTLAQGGESGPWTVETGEGGKAAGGEAGERQGGASGNWIVRTGLGGAATSGTGTRNGGGSGRIELSTGKGGTGGTLGGTPGEILIKVGKVGTGGVPTSNPITLQGGAATTDALSGNIVFKTGKVEAGTERLSITGDGTANFKNRVGLKRVAPAEITASEKKYKPGEGVVFLLKAKAGVKIEGIEAPPQEGALYKFINVGTEEIAFTNETAGGEEPLILATGAETKIAKNHGIDFWYDGTAKKWRQAGVF